jgi:membrane-anchored mycosin MYCP
LVRSRFPELTAQQVIDRLTAGAQGAARAPSNLTGAGLVDPVAALTWDVSGAVDATTAPSPKALAAPPQPAPRDNTPRLIAFAGTGALASVAIATAAIAAYRRKESST